MKGALPDRGTKPSPLRRPTAVIIAAGSNLGDRAHHLRRAIAELRRVVTVCRVSSTFESDPIDAPAGSPDFLNLVVLAHTELPPPALLATLLAIEQAMGRRRRERNGPRPIDLDLVLHGATLLRTRFLTLPHPRYREREFVLAPLRELALGWHDPSTNVALSALRGAGNVRPVRA